jgi:hypothetical protein
MQNFVVVGVMIATWAVAFYFIRARNDGSNSRPPAGALGRARRIVDAGGVTTS